MVSRRYLYDGRELNVNTLVELRLLLLQAGIDASIEVIRQATMALAAANPAADPWDAALEAFWKVRS
jgi:hypothetical protein